MVRFFKATTTIYRVDGVWDTVDQPWTIGNVPQTEGGVPASYYVDEYPFRVASDLIPAEDCTLAGWEASMARYFFQQGYLYELPPAVWADLAAAGYTSDPIPTISWGGPGGYRGMRRNDGA